MSGLPEIRCKKCNKMIGKGKVDKGNIQCKCGYLNEYKVESNITHRGSEKRNTELIK